LAEQVTATIHPLETLLENRPAPQKEKLADLALGIQQARRQIQGSITP
jgi:hypothetical protein